MRMNAQIHSAYGSRPPLGELTCVFLSGTIPYAQAKQLKDYENAVIAKRLAELDEDEVQALVEEVDKDSF